ncbi:MAG: sigma-70 family RNA polymerase sigma factor [Chloroflexi bacterium]|nr:MAG: sigma-70 family RNA polymerase sigma factor [Chloroflexota bacterium]
MAHLAVIHGLIYTDLTQVFNRWLVPTYKTAFRWTGNRVDSEDATTWVFLAVAGQLRLPELVQVVDKDVLDAGLEALRRHWADRYGIARVRCGEIRGSEEIPGLESLFDGLTAEMRLALVLRFLRRRSPATIAPQLGIRPEAARRRIIAALGRVAQCTGLQVESSEPVQTDQVSGFIDDVVARRRPVRFEVLPEAWPPMIGAGHVQAAIAGNDLPTHEFVRTLERRLEDRAGRRFVTDLRIWSA